MSGTNSASAFTDALKPENIVYNNDLKNGIDIQGVINAPGGISLHATKIDVGSDAKLHTDVEGIDFSKVVNIMSGDKIVVDSGITGGLDAEYKDGDIILKAYAEEILDDSELDEVTDEIAADWDKISERSAIINVDGTLKSANDLTLTNFPHGGFCYLQPMLLMIAKSDSVSCKGRCPNPSRKMFIAAFLSRSCSAPHFGHFHCRIFKSFTCGFFSQQQ